MAITSTRPLVSLKDDQGTTLSTHPHERGAVLAATALGNGSYTVVRPTWGLTVDSVDTIRPVITLIGSSTVDVTTGTTYSDLGAIASDNMDGDLTGSIVTVSTVDTGILGTYTVSYNVSDAAGNTAITVTRTVEVISEAPDTTAPVITLLGSASVSFEVGTAYTDAGATAIDDVDGVVTQLITTVNPVDINTVGIYTVSYDVSDTAGNAAITVVRTVEVVAVVVPPPPTSDLQVSLSSTVLPLDSLVYGLAVEVGDVIDYENTTTCDDGSVGTVLIDTLGVPTITGTAGMHVITATWTNQTTTTVVGL